MAFGAGEGLGCPRGGGDTAKSWEEAFDFPEAPALGAACRSVWRVDLCRLSERVLGSHLWLHMSPALVGARAARAGPKGDSSPWATAPVPVVGHTLCCAPSSGPRVNGKGMVSVPELGGGLSRSPSASSVKASESCSESPALSLETATGPPSSSC